jgi:hypothetical protein
MVMGIWQHLELGLMAWQVLEQGLGLPLRTMVLMTVSRAGLG